VTLTVLLAPRNAQGSYLYPAVRLLINEVVPKTGLGQWPRNGHNPSMDERDFYNEKEETKQLTLVCPHCRQENSYPIRWKVRTKKDQLPRGAGNEDRKKFEKARTYMVRVDDLVACRNLRCRKRFELTGQTVVLL